MWPSASTAPGYLIRCMCASFAADTGRRPASEKWILEGALPAAWRADASVTGAFCAATRPVVPTRIRSTIDCGASCIGSAPSAAVELIQCVQKCTAVGTALEVGSQPAVGRHAGGALARERVLHLVHTSRSRRHLPSQRGRAPRQRLRQRDARPPQMRLHRIHRHAQCGGDVGLRELLDAAQHHHLALRQGQRRDGALDPRGRLARFGQELAVGRRVLALPPVGRRVAPPRARAACGSGCAPRWRRWRRSTARRALGVIGRRGAVNGTRTPPETDRRAPPPRFRNAPDSRRQDAGSASTSSANAPPSPSR